VATDMGACQQKLSHVNFQLRVKDKTERE